MRVTPKEISALNDIYKYWLNVYKDQTVDVSTVVIYFSNGGSDVCDKPCFRQHCTVVKSKMKCTSKLHS